MLSSILFMAALPVLALDGSARPAPPVGLSVSSWTSIRAEHERHRQAAFAIPGGHKARNYNQQWTTRFDSRGFDVTPDTGDWRWGLALVSYGHAGRERVVAKASVDTKLDTLSYQWDSTIREWFVNGSAGLEHGFTLASSPSGNPGRLVLHLAIRGNLEPRVSADGQAVTFLTGGGVSTLIYSGLKVFDADHRAIAARFIREHQGLRLEVDDHGARYPITIDPTAQQAYLKPAQVGTFQTGDWFGYSVSISGDTVVVGAPQEDSASLGVNSIPDELAAGSSGAAYVFVRNSGVWTQQAYLKPIAVGPGGQAGDHFGWSVGISGDTVVVGAPDEDSATTGTNSTPAEGATNAGAVYVFTRAAGAWSQQAYLKTASTRSGDEFGFSVAISGDTIVAGAFDEASSTTGVNSSPNTGAAGAGAAFVFVRTSGSWSQQAYLKPAAVGTSQQNDHFGNSVAVSGDIAVVGAFQEDSSSTGVNSTPNELAGAAGAAYIFARSAGVWSQQAYLKPAAVGVTQSGDLFGTSVAASGDTVAVGAPGEASSSSGVNSVPNEGAGSAGAVYVFTVNGGVWSQQAYVKPNSTGNSPVGDSFGTSVAISGDVLAVGSTGEDSSSTGVNSTPDKLASMAGAAYLFTRSTGTWVQQAYLKPAAVGTTQAGDNFGLAIAVSGDTVIVGANLEDSSTLGINSTPNELAVDSGAAYAYVTSSGGVTFSPAGEMIRSTGAISRAIAVTAGSGAAWTATSNSSWIAITAGASGTGNGTVSYDVTANGELFSRVGAITIAGAAFLIVQAGTANTAPAPEISGPIVGSGSTKTFVLQFSHINGFDQLNVVNALIHQYLNGDSACYIAYSRPAQVLYLVNDQGPGSGISAGLALGQSGAVSNSQCTVNSAGSSAVGSGNLLTLTLNITFKAAFAGSKAVYLAAGDLSGLNSGWRTMGYHEVPGAVVSYPKAGSTSPAAVIRSGNSGSGVLSFDFDDSTSVTNLQTVWALINTAIDGRQACYAAYYVPGNAVFLYPDSGDGSQATNIVLSGTNSIENSQCRISAAGSSVTKVGSKLTVNLNYTFKGPLAGAQGAWTAVQTLAGVTSAWKITGALLLTK